MGTPSATPSLITTHCCSCCGCCHAWHGFLLFVIAVQPPQHASLATLLASTAAETAYIKHCSPAAAHGLWRCCACHPAAAQCTPLAVLGLATSSSCCHVLHQHREPQVRTALLRMAHASHGACSMCISCKHAALQRRDSCRGCTAT